MDTCKHCQQMVPKGSIKSHLPNCPAATLCTGCNQYYSNSYYNTHLQGNCKGGARPNTQQGCMFGQNTYQQGGMGGVGGGQYAGMFPSNGAGGAGPGGMGGGQMMHKPIPQMLANGYQPGSGLLPIQTPAAMNQMIGGMNTVPMLGGFQPAPQPVQGNYQMPGGYQNPMYSTVQSNYASPPGGFQPASIGGYPPSQQGGNQGRTRICKYCGQPFTSNADIHLIQCPNATRCQSCKNYFANNFIQQHAGQCQGGGGI